MKSTGHGGNVTQMGELQIRLKHAKVVLDKKLFFFNRFRGFDMGETTPPPDSPPLKRQAKDDGFPKVYNMTSNAFTVGGIAKMKAEGNGNLQPDEKPEIHVQKMDQSETMSSESDKNSPQEKHKEDLEEKSRIDPTNDLHSLEQTEIQADR